MPQSPIAVYNYFKNAITGLSQVGLSDAAGIVQTSGGGLKSALNLTAATAIKATPGRIAKIVVIAPGSTGGAFTFNDCATTGAATTANQIFTLAFGAASNVQGAVFSLEFPCAVGIVLSAVPTGGSPQLVVSYS